MLKVISIFILLLQYTYGYINIYPSFFYEELRKEGISKIFTLTNRTNRPLRYRLYFEDNIVETENINLEIYPKSITLLPFENKEFKIYMEPTYSLKKGIYNGKLVIKEVHIPREEKKDILTEFKMNLGVYYGNIPLLLEIETKNMNDIVELKIRNNSNRTGLLSLYRYDKKEENFLDSFILRKDDIYTKEIKKLKNKQLFVLKDEKGVELEKIIVEGEKGK
ncbi:hypothetical protein [Cetobacterium sp.]|uniref:hypothetical protein n=1 Tax=Cetobacterium sp. TaxID=2071632 RepID=UPI003F386662